MNKRFNQNTFVNPLEFDGVGIQTHNDLLNSNCGEFATIKPH